jgi:hypothetical protein
VSDLVAKIGSWLWNKLVALLIIVLLLVIAAWVRAETKSIRAKWDEAARNEQLADRLTGELSPLMEQREKLEKESAELGKQLSSLESARSAAREGEKLAWEALEAIKKEEKFYYTGWTKWSDPTYTAKLEAAEKAVEMAKAGRELADKDWSDIEGALKSSPAGQELARLQQQIDQRRGEIESLRQTATAYLNQAADSPLQRVKLKAMEVLPTALTVLAGIILVPIAIKAFLYWCVAPLVGQANPVRLLPASAGDVSVAPSATSVPVTLDPGDEVVVHSKYLQAAGAGPGKRTRWLLSWRMPFTSIAAGLYTMVSVRNKGAEATSVTVSPKSDLFDQIVSIEVPEGSSLVIYPRSLVGIVLKDGIEPKISRHWKIANLHSWVTFQFRYLVVHGQCQILLKGCRGVRAEKVATDSQPRMQDQGATLGFSANLAYSAERCEAFVDYLLGRDQLFNDKFSAADGVFLSEEVPDPRRKKGGLFGRGFEGLLDGVLKAFGI